MKIVLHARVSTEEQRKNGYSLEEMVRVLREYAAQLGATIVEEIASDFANEGPDRGDVERLLELAHSGEIDAVMFFNVGRATRGGPGEYWMLTETLKKAGVGIYFAEERRKVGDSPEDEFLYGMKAVWAQVEKHEIKQRTMRGWQGKALRGEYVGHGKMNYGYQRIGEKKSLTIEEHPDAAPIVREIFDRFTGWHNHERQGVRKIVRELTSRLVPTPIDLYGGKYGDRKRRQFGHWCFVTVYKILRNPIYKGVAYAHRLKSIGYKRSRNNKRYIEVKRRPQKEWIATRVPMLVPEEQWELAQAILDQGRAQSSRNAKHEYLIGRRIRCACGCIIRGRLQKRESGHIYRYYTCHRSDMYATHSCDLRVINADRIEAEVWAWIERRFLTEETIQAVAVYDASKDKHITTSTNEQIKLLHTKLNNLQSEEDEVYRMRRKKQIDDRRMEQQLAEIRHERESIQSSLDTLEKRQRSELLFEQYQVRVRDLVAYYRELADRSGFAVRRGLIDDLDIEVQVKQLDTEHIEVKVYSVFAFDETKDQWIMSRKH